MATSSWGFAAFAQNTMLSKPATLFESGNATAPPGASYLLSMVFKICHPKSPGADMPARERPCLEHVQRRPGLLVAFSLSLVSFKRVNFQGTWRGFCSLGVVLPGGMNMASCLISTVFKIYHPKIPGADIPSGWKPCLSNLLSPRCHVQYT